MSTETRNYLLGVIRITEDHLAQYRAYSEAMRAEGRGLYLSSAYNPETLAIQLAGAKRLIAQSH